jgi:hypothetical protein
VENSTNCPHGGEDETRSLYLAGKLPEKEAEAFESHYFGCASCAEAVEVGAQLLASYGNVPVRSTAPVRARFPRTWIPLAAAAVAGFVAVGVWQIARREPSLAGSSGLRSTSHALEVQAEASGDGGFELTWTGPANAASFTVEVFDADGATLWEGGVTEPRFRVAPEVLAKARGSSPPAVTIEAFDALRQSIAKSESKTLVTP